MTNPRPTIDPENPFAATLAGFRDRPQHQESAQWATQGGGVAIEDKNGNMVFIEKPDCPGLDVGDYVPKERGLIPTNNAAQDEMDGY